ncbi:MAG TPA: magnesium transporter [Thermohalobaculum sp.]|nr:magnesium transporter [Thermohalobaculum sp.]
MRAPKDAADLLAREAPDRIRATLESLPGDFARRVAEHLPDASKLDDLEFGQEQVTAPESVTELMEPLPASVVSGTTVADAIAVLRQADAAAYATYLYVTAPDGRLAGLVVMRDLVLAEPGQTVDQIMLSEPFALRTDTPVPEACKAAVSRHYPVYPVVDGDHRPVGQVRGWRLFEQQVIEISAQSGQMVGVAKEERVFTPLVASFLKRHPWLQINLLTAFVAAYVVGSFADTIEKVVALAAFLPVLAGQSGNTGCQALAITLRGLALGDVDRHSRLKLITREAVLGAGNGLIVGLVAALAMWFYAASIPETADQAFALALVIVLAMTGACIASGVSGVLIPIVLRRLGADPATASAIFLTTITDIAGMGLMLILATALVL